jgi:asparagine N-glycosylation enzyme membrane subunit Stt3
LEAALVAKVQRSRKFAVVALLSLILVLSALVSMKLDIDNRDLFFQNTIRDSPNGMQAFQKLAEVTPSDAIILSWWDYGRAIQEFGNRRSVVSYPSRDILASVAESQNPLNAAEMQLFGTYESSEKIHDVAKAFLLPEDQALAIMRKYGATHVMVFTGEDEQGAFNDIQKFYWIARIAGYNGSDYVRTNSASPAFTYELTSKADQVTMLRLLFDDRFHPQHFAKLYENEVVKIYRIVYPGTQSAAGLERGPALPAHAIAPNSKAPLDIARKDTS